MEFEKLNKRVVKWANDKGILEKATPLTQHEKTEEEVLELGEALYYQSKKEDTYINTKGVLCTTDEEILDGLGDSLVTLLIQCKLQDLNPLKALETALNVIEHRTGKMINGQFVKNN